VELNPNQAGTLQTVDMGCSGGGPGRGRGAPPRGRRRRPPDKFGRNGSAALRRREGEPRGSEAAAAEGRWRQCQEPRGLLATPRSVSRGKKR